MIKGEYKTYADPELRETWAGYIRNDEQTEFYPADGGEPVLVDNATGLVVTE